MNNHLGTLHMNPFLAAAVSASLSHRPRSFDPRRCWIAAILLSSVLALAGCGGASTHSQDAKHDDEHTQAEGQQHETASSEREHYERLELTPEARKAAGLTVAPAGPALLRETVALYGIVKPNAERMRTIAARFPGVVRSVHVRVGDPVEQGASLAIVESNESLQEYAVRSPLSGVVTERVTNPGERADGPLFTVADLSSVWVELALYARDRERVHTGQPVRIQTTDGGVVGEGKIVFVSALSTARTQSLTARVLLDNHDGRWSPGLYVRGEVSVGEVTLPLAVPAAALQELDHGPSVFVDEGQVLHPHAVKVGRSDGNVVEILAGVTAGETVVGEGSFVLKAELGKGEAEHAH